MYFEYKDAKIYYEVAGEGKPLLFLHGFGGSTESFCGAFRYFAKRRRCISIDFAGFGKSEEPKTPYSLSDYVNQVKALQKIENADNCDIICHSFGGRVAIKLLSKESEIERAVLVAPAGVKTLRNLSYYFSVLRYKTAKLLKLDLRGYGSKDYKSLSPVMKQTFTLVVNEDLKRDVKKISARCLVVEGEGDEAVRKSQTRYIAKNIAGAQLLTLAGGHFCYLNCCSLFCELTEEFLNGD